MNWGQSRVLHCLPEQPSDGGTRYVLTWWLEIEPEAVSAATDGIRVRATKATARMATFMEGGSAAAFRPRVEYPCRCSRSDETKRAEEGFGNRHVAKSSHMYPPIGHCNC